MEILSKINNDFQLDIDLVSNESSDEINYSKVNFFENGIIIYMIKFKGEYYFLIDHMGDINIKDFYDYFILHFRKRLIHSCNNFEYYFFKFNKEKFLLLNLKSSISGIFFNRGNYNGSYLDILIEKKNNLIKLKLLNYSGYYGNGEKIIENYLIIPEHIFIKEIEFYKNKSNYSIQSDIILGKDIYNLINSKEVIINGKSMSISGYRIYSFINKIIQKGLYFDYKQFKQKIINLFRNNAEIYFDEKLNLFKLKEEGLKYSSKKLSENSEKVNNIIKDLILININDILIKGNGKFKYIDYNGDFFISFYKLLNEIYNRDKDIFKKIMFTLSGSSNIRSVLFSSIYYNIIIKNIKGKGDNNGNSSLFEYINIVDIDEVNKINIKSEKYKEFKFSLYKNKINVSNNFDDIFQLILSTGNTKVKFFILPYNDISDLKKINYNKINYYTKRNLKEDDYLLLIDFPINDNNFLNFFYELGQLSNLKEEKKLNIGRVYNLQGYNTYYNNTNLKSIKNNIDCIKNLDKKDFIQYQLEISRILGYEKLKKYFLTLNFNEIKQDNYNNRFLNNLFLGFSSTENIDINKLVKVLKDNLSDNKFVYNGFEVEFGLFDGSNYKEVIDLTKNFNSCLNIFGLNNKIIGIHNLLHSDYVTNNILNGFTKTILKNDLNINLGKIRNYLIFKYCLLFGLDLNNKTKDITYLGNYDSEINNNISGFIKFKKNGKLVGRSFFYISKMNYIDTDSKWGEFENYILFDKYYGESIINKESISEINTIIFKKLNIGLELFYNDIKHDAFKKIPHNFKYIDKNNIGNEKDYLSKKFISSSEYYNYELSGVIDILH